MVERSCQLTGKPFQLTEAEESAYAHFEIPIPNLGPEERFRRLAAFRPEKQFFLRGCDATSVRLFSVYPERCAFSVYSLEHWMSSAFDPLQYGQNFEFKRLFVEQLLELWRKVPHPAFLMSSSPGSRICHRVWNAKDSFLVFDSRNIDHCFYSTALTDCAYCLDSYQLAGCSWCYDTLVSERCERLRFAEFCSGCRDSWFLSNCTNCDSCLFCVNLEGKRFHIFNQPVSEEQYRRTLRELAFDAGPLLELAKNRYRDFLVLQAAPHILSDDAAAGSGNYLRRSSTVGHSFEIFDSRQIFNSRDVRDSTLCLDTISVWGSREVAQSVSIYNGQRLLNCIDCWDNVTDLAYCTFCRESANLFGCIGLHGKEYCIFNQQYSRADYLALREKIVRHLKDRSIWGTPLPMSFSAHAYNHSAANEYMPGVNRWKRAQQTAQRVGAQGVIAQRNGADVGRSDFYDRDTAERRTDDRADSFIRAK